MKIKFNYENKITKGNNHHMSVIRDNKNEEEITYSPQCQEEMTTEDK